MKFYENFIIASAIYGQLAKKIQRFSIFRNALNKGTQNRPFLLGHPVYNNFNEICTVCSKCNHQLLGAVRDAGGCAGVRIPQWEVHVHTANIDSGCSAGVDHHLPSSSLYTVQMVCDKIVKNFVI